MLEVLMGCVGLLLLLIVNVSWVYYLGGCMVFVIFLFLELNYEMSDWHLFCEGVGADVFSVGLVALSVWVIVLMILASSLSIWSRGSMGLFLVIFLLLAVIFVSLDFLMFYVAFEAVLIPTVVLVLGWGYQPERLGAGIYLLFYTVFCSLPLLMLILYLVGIGGALWGFSDSASLFSGSLGGEFFILGVCGSLGFLVKVPLFGLHLWLPSAHVEAPVTGSMILAGILLKLGGYGLMRFSQWSWGVFMEFSGFFIVLSLVGGVYLSLVCLRQVDLKSLIAYSSVVHMGLVVGGLFSGYSLGWAGAFVMMVGHGLCSSGLFFYAGVNYDRLGSRSVLMNSGLMLVFPSSVLFWFLFVSSNMAAPPSLNLMGELMLFGSLIGWSQWLIGLMMAGSFLVGVYCLFLFSWVQHGRPSLIMRGGSGLMVTEGLISVLHWAPLNMLFLSGDLFMF